MRVCGLMSGTSLDGLDIAVVDFSYENANIRHELLTFTTKPYDDALRTELLHFMDPLTPLHVVSSMNMYLGELFAELLTEALLEANIDVESIDLISSHGQTIWHEPTINTENPYSRPNTLQIGDIAVIAERSGRTVIGDFRTRDMAVGGQGAPLVPFADQILFQSDTIGRVLLNIGGIANMTVLPSKQSTKNIIAYDTGPGNMVIDACVAKHSNGQITYDSDGTLAESGRVSDEWLMRLLEHDYFQASIPKSTGRELFGASYVDRLWEDGDAYRCTSIDKIATVTMLTAKTIVSEIQKYKNSHEIKEVIVSGGGVHNKTLMKFLRELLPEEIRLDTSEGIGIDADAKEAFVFALLGYLGMQKVPNSLPAATGANKKTIMGKIAWGTPKAESGVKL